MPKPIALYWFRQDRGASINFGDDLSPALVAHLSGRPVVHAPPQLCDLAAVGSILQHVRRQRDKARSMAQRLAAGRFGPTRIWGSGAFGPKGLPRSWQVEVFALRGPMTRAAMGLPETLPLGDPGLLVDRLIPPAPKRHRWGIVPHVDDFTAPAIKALAEALAAPVIDLRQPDVRATLCDIQACDFVLSSSLHGLITADAFGIPSRWISLSDGLWGGNWKFQDYFASVGRTVPEPLRFFDGSPWPIDRAAFEATADCADPRHLDAMRDGLVTAFERTGL